MIGCTTMVRAILALILATLTPVGCGGVEADEAVTPAPLGACGAATVDRGIEVDQILPSFDIRDCDGNPTDTDALCGPRVRVLLDFCGWCPISLSHSKLLPSVQASYGPHGAQVIVIVVSETNGGPPTSAFCRKIQEQLGPDIKVFFDPTGTYKDNAAKQSDTFYIITDQLDGTPANRIAAKADKPNLTTWLKPILDTLGPGEIVLDTITTPEEMAIPFCLDMAATGFDSTADTLGGPPRSETSEIIEDFCHCVVDGREKAFLELYLESLEFDTLFDGLTSAMQHFRTETDYPAIYHEYLASCAHLINMDPLERLTFGTGHVPACSDSDGGKDADAAAIPGSVSGIGLTDALMLRLTFDRVRENAFVATGPAVPRYEITPEGVWLGTMVIDDECLDETTLQETWCDGAEMRSTDIVCPGGCSKGRCLASGGAD